MRPEDIKKLRDARPFIPFKAVFTDGRAVLIPHPDHLFIAKHVIEIGVEPDPVTNIPSETIHASPLHIVRLEASDPVAG